MIPEIREIGFPVGPDGKKLATLDSATVTISDMGDRVISTQVKIDGDVVPDFSGWELEFRGERFVLPSKEPQAVKDNTTMNSVIDLNFRSWPVMELQRYFFMSLSMIETNVGIADQYKTPINLPVEQFVTLFNKVLFHYFGNKIRMDLYQMGEDVYSKEPVLVDINYTKIWDVLIKFYELFGLRWRIEYDTPFDAYVIKVGYDTSDYDIDDHDFEYGYSGGLVKFERQVADEDIRNIILGRGGEKNLPYRYFKRVDENNPEWAADPDAIPELKDVYFDRLRDANFRSYVQGWKTNPNRDDSWDPETEAYDAVRGETDFAYKKGHFDESFDPVEYVKDQESIDQYGEHWGALDDNDEIFPTIQGRFLEDIGRADEVVAVSEIATDDVQSASDAESIRQTMNSMLISLDGTTETVHEILSEEFTVPEGYTGTVVEYTPVSKLVSSHSVPISINTEYTTLVAVKNNVEYPVSGIPAGTYRLKLHLVLQTTAQTIRGTFGYENIVIETSDGTSESWKPTFDIWIKDIFKTQKDAGETDDQYAFRVWSKILGDRVGNEAKIVFSTGPMATSEDYEFTIAEYPHFDQSKLITTTDEDGNPIDVESEWRLTLYKSSAEFDATGLYIPTTVFKPVAGDKFFFIGIDMPFEYVDWAEKKLRAYKETELDKSAEVAKTWVINFDKVRINTLEDGEYELTLAQRMMAGAKIRTKDKRFTNGDVLTLYVQTLTYTWNVPSEGNPYIYPDIEAVLSDKVVSRESPVSKMQNELDVVKSNYVQESDVESAVRRVASSLYLKKTGERDASLSPTSFSSSVTSENFRPGGVGGRGWGIYRNNYRKFSAGDPDTEDETADDSVIEADRVIVRKEMQVNSLVVNQISYIGGREIISAAKIEVSNVVETSGSYICYFDQKQNSVQNLFVVGDIAYGQVFSPTNVSLRYYKMYVTAVDVNSITLSKSGRDGSGAPQVGDVIVQFGNRQDPRRQYVIIRDVIGGGYERMLNDLTETTSAGNEYYFAGILNNFADEFVELRTLDDETLEDSDGLILGYGYSRPTARWFVGDLDHEYAEWKDGVLNIRGRIAVYKNDGTYVSMAQYMEDNDVTYLREATNEGTLIDGGLVLTSLIQLGQTESGVYKVYAGINGLMSESAIAAWYGGPMIDKEAIPVPSTYAKSLFRFDGSGYLASGNISWDRDGYGHIPGVSWGWDQEAHESYIRIDGDVKLGSVGNDTVTSMLQLLRQISSWFGEDSNGDIFVQKKTVSGQLVARNFYSYGFITAGGIGSSGGGGGGGGASLIDVWRSLTNSNSVTGQDAESQTIKIATAHLPVLNAYDGITASYSSSGAGGSLETNINLGISSVAIAKVTGLATALQNMSDAIDDIPIVTYNQSTKVLSIDGVTVSMNYLPLSGGTMDRDASISFSDRAGLKNEDDDLFLSADGSSTRLGVYNKSGNIYLNTGSASHANNKLYHKKGSTDYEIWDKANLANPVSYTTLGGKFANDVIGIHVEDTDTYYALPVPTSVFDPSDYPSEGILTLATQDWADNHFLKLTGGTVAGALTVQGLATFTGGIRIGSQTLPLTYDSSASAWKLAANFYATGFITAGGVGSSGGGGGSTSEWYNIKMKREKRSVSGVNKDEYEVTIENYTSSLTNSSAYKMVFLRWRKGSGKSSSWHAPFLSPSSLTNNIPVTARSWAITARVQDLFNGTDWETIINTTTVQGEPLKFKASRNRKLRFGCAVYKYTGEGTYGWHRISNIAYVELFINNNGTIKKSIRLQ